MISAEVKRALVDAVAIACAFSTNFYDWRLIMFKRMFALMLTALYLAGTTITLTACNTMEGAGKDIEKGGEKIQEEAVEEKND